MATQTLQLGQRDVMIAGGMESMSNVPFYFPRNASFGHQQALDGIIKDGLWDVYNQVHMGNCAEETAKKYRITREQQDLHAITSYKRSSEAWEKGLFHSEIIPISVKSRKGDVLVDKDEEYKNVDFSKVGKLKGAFVKDGIIKQIITTFYL
jgi:acetyl-CoA C-acetyltransferase